MPKCKHCGSEVEDGDIFCVHCGNKIDGSKDIEKEEPVKGKHEEEPVSNPKREEKEEKEEKSVKLEEEPEIYHSTSRTLKAKTILYGASIIIILIIIGSIYALFHEIFSGPRSELKNCPYECCLLRENSTFLEKKCENPYAECIEFSCVLAACPYECCDSLEFQAKECPEEHTYCLNNTCVKEDCPFECCLGNLGYQLKKCANGGSCVNNECLLKPCPEEFECCMDELEYQDKLCLSGRTCVDRECKIAIFELMKKYIGAIIDVFKSLL